MTHKKQVLIKRKEEHTQDERLCALECTVEQLTKEIKKMATDTSKLEAKVTALEAAEKAREERDTVQDAVTAQNIKVLTDQVAALQAIIDAGSTDPATQAKIDAVSDRLDAVITSLDAADPTPPAPVA